MKSWKKIHTKVAKKNFNCFFSLLPWAAQMAQTEEFMFQNVPYRPTVYKIGVSGRKAGSEKWRQGCEGRAHSTTRWSDKKVKTGSAYNYVWI